MFRAKFEDVVKKFNYILVDNYGVVTFANGIERRAVEVLRRLRQDGKKVIFLSNATFLSASAEERYAKKGLIKGVHYDAFITSGQYASEDIAKGTLPCGKRYVVFGTANFKSSEPVPAIFNGSPYECVRHLDEADFVYCGIPQVSGKDVVTMTDLMPEIRRFAESGLPMVCSNPDEIASEDGRWVIRQGSIVREYRRMGRKVILYGKPDARIFDYTLGNVPRKEVLMVGDTLGTDILGANVAGIKSCLTIDGGVTEMRMKERQMRVSRENVELFIRQQATGDPTYIVDSIF